MAVRPERMRLALTAVAGDAERGSNEVRGIVRNVVYTGSDTQYFVELGASGVVMVRVANDAERGPAPAPGQGVVVRWEPESTAVLVG